MSVALVSGPDADGGVDRAPGARPDGDAQIQTLAEIGELYAAFADRLARIVRFNVRAPQTVIEDACQVAWTRLLHHRGRVRRDAVRGWLSRTATHEALKLLRREDREKSLESMLEPVGAHLPAAGRRPATTLEELVERRMRLESVASLPRRQQRLVWLHGLGFSYDEMARDCGCTRRTVERQLLRGKRTLRSVGTG